MTENEREDRFQEAQRQIWNANLKRGSRWRHRKGSIYYLDCAAIIEATLTPAVVYRSEDGTTVWVRPLSEFLDGRFTEVASYDRTRNP